MIRILVFVGVYLEVLLFRETAICGLCDFTIANRVELEPKCIAKGLFAVGFRL